MAKNKGRLDTLLRVRRIEEDRAKAELAQANHHQRQAQQREVEALATYQSLAEPSAEGDLGDFFRQHAVATAAARAVVLRAADHQEASAATEQARNAAVEATMRSEGLQRLVDRVADVRFQEMLAADQRTAEESMTGKASRGRQ